MRSLPWLVLLVACGDPNDGTAVGNPGKLVVQVVDLPEGTELQSGAFDVAALQLVGRRVTIVQYEDPFDLVNPGEVEFPAGNWDQVVVLPRGSKPLVLQGLNAEGAPFELRLDVEPMVFEGSFTVDGDEVIVGLRLAQGTQEGEQTAGFPSELLLRADDGGGGPIGVGDGLYLDGNLDGQASQSELASSSVEPKSCSTAASLTGLVWLPLLLISRRR